MTHPQSFERGLELYAALVQENPALATELVSSREEFGPAPADAAARERYERRHFEWFLFDRPSDCLEGAPVEALYSRWHEEAELEQRDLTPAFLESTAGIFVVTESRPGVGVVVNDLMGLGTYEVEEREAAAELTPGDFVVGRLHPMSENAHRFSPVAETFHETSLLDALRDDLECMRKARRGVLRIQQSDLESLFFSAADDALPRGKAVNPEDADQQALEVMRAAGIAPETCSEVLVAVKQSAKAGDTETVLDILNQLAYDTDVDLEELRQVFAEISAATRTATSASPSASRDPAPKEARPAQAALAEFDRGRAAGRDLNELFGTLERELDIDRDEAGAVALDGAVTRFPGVVGAMIEEFLWDVERQHGKAAAQSYEQLRLLSEYAANVEDFEELGEREMLDFSARWLLDEGEVAPAKARAVLGALEPFCRWCEEQHSHALWKAFGSALEELKESVPRLIELRATRARDEHLSSGAFRVCEVAETGLLLESLALGADDAKRVHIEITPQQAKHVRADDLVRLTAAEPLRIGACYPAPVASFLRSHA